MLFPLASRNRVSLFQSLESRQQQMTQETCGRPHGMSFASYDHATHSWRTSQVSLLSLMGILDESSVTWPRWGTMQDGVCWALAPSVRHTHVKDCGRWPTPGRIDEDFCRMKVDTARERMGQAHVTSVLIAKHGKRYPLPSFGEALMGFPVGWVMDGQPLGMRKFQLWCDSHGRC
jgi:hypothetical protein